MLSMFNERYIICSLTLDEFIQLTNENFHLRTAHSKLMGYWITEYGGLNEVTQMWQYGKFMNETIVCEFKVITKPCPTLWLLALALNIC